MGTYEIMIGDIRCVVIQEGTAEFDLSAMPKRHPNATQAEIDDALAKIGLEGDTSDNYFNALYIESGDTKLLVDTGMGNNPDRPQIGKLIPNLATIGVTAEDIDIVYITHFHGDHYIALLTDGQPTFPNARYVTLDAEWDAWLSDAARERLGDNIQHLLSIVEPIADQFTTIADGEELVAGVKAVAMTGHTMGHSGLLIESGNESLLHMVDLLHHPTQFHYPEWQFVYDTDGALAVESRNTHLSQAAADKRLLMFYHLPFPGLGYVEKTGDTFKWSPIES